MIRHWDGEMTNCRRGKPWLQFSLRTLLVFMLLASALMGWFGTKLQQARKQREAVDAITSQGGFVFYDYQLAETGDADIYARRPGPPRLRRLLGVDVFARVIQAGVVNGGLEHAAALPSLQLLVVYHPLTDADLKCLADLRRLTELRVLDLEGSSAGDALVDHVKGLTQLRMLRVKNTLTSEGVRKIRDALPDCLVVTRDD